MGLLDDVWLTESANLVVSITLNTVTAWRRVGLSISKQAIFPSFHQ